MGIVTVPMYIKLKMNLQSKSRDRMINRTILSTHTLCTITTIQDAAAALLGKRPKADSSMAGYGGHAGCVRRRAAQPSLACHLEKSRQ
jgi:hypothetical protein